MSEHGEKSSTLILIKLKIMPLNCTVVIIDLPINYILFVTIV